MTLTIKDNVIDANVIIAVFMGWHDEVIQSFTPPNNRLYFCSPVGQERITLSYPIVEGDLKYQESWDELVPVVDKIIYQDWEREGELLSLIIQREMSYAKIDRVWLSVVDFIRWYNKNQNHDKV